MNGLLSHLDQTAPDPFGGDSSANFLGIYERSAERAAEEAVLAELNLSLEGHVLASPDVAYYRFANGYAAGVLLGDAARPACSVADPGAPFELAVLHGRALHVCYASPLASDVICPLDAVGVRASLAQIAALPRRAGCRHKRS